MEQPKIHRASSKWRTVLKIATIIFLGGVIIIIATAYFLYPRADEIIKDRILSAFDAAYPAYSLRIGAVHYNFATNRIVCDSVALMKRDSSFLCSIASFKLRGISRKSLFRGDTRAENIFAGVIVDAKEIAIAVPSRQYEYRCARIILSVPDAKISVDSLDIHPAGSSPEDESSYRVTSFSLHGIDAKDILRNGRLDSVDFVNAIAEAKGITADFPRAQYEIHGADIRASIADSEIAADSVTVNSLSGDDRFFAASTYRRTLFTAAISGCTAHGTDIFGLLQKNRYHARSVQLAGAFLKVLINKEKPFQKHGPNPLMPNQALALVKAAIQVDTFAVTNARLVYQERFEYNAKPAELAFENVKVMAQGFSNDSDADAYIRAQGNFMKAGAGLMKMTMTIPPASRGLSLHYSGSLDKMDILSINAWLEIAEHKRIKSGNLDSASYDITVSNNRATGNVHAIYRDLSLAALDEKRKEGGFIDAITTFLMNVLKLRGTNVPDKSGAMKIGKVHYVKKPDDAFFQVVWYALRSGLGDVVGF